MLLEGNAVHAFVDFVDFRRRERVSFAWIWRRGDSLPSRSRSLTYRGKVDGVLFRGHGIQTLNFPPFVRTVVVATIPDLFPVETAHQLKYIISRN